MSQMFVLEPVLFQSAMSLAATGSSNTIKIKYANLAGIQLNWTGTPTGTINLQGSLDDSTYVTMTLSAAIAPAGSADTGLIDILDTAMPYLKILYTRTSGTGSMNIYLNYKQP